MTDTLGVLAALLATVVMAPAEAHALELPGKLRLSRAEYTVVQRIYYPGFTRAGIAEIPGVLVAAAALAVTDAGTADFVLRSVALAALSGVQAVYWLRVHPVNRIWLEEQDLDRLSTGFFALGSRHPPGGDASYEAWATLRNRWESGHVLRAALATIAVTSLVVALA
ncbi:hypothetical protein [Streptomyces sp. WMMB 322]|uniref:hypothetical protein n=1 Tax=Streptomyces sp. WMMB 322 TaxID=1286821 RepID=UPI0006E3A516|nr:hypothetical protein [Streptomyces sp. WMMB 322]SCK13762.1 hypothetical protein H180DRAFT_00852 [Streptomyces sp. WMMB 322]